MSELVKCATCKTEKPFSEMQTCMHAEREHSVCDMNCMIKFYKGEIKPDIVITPDLEEMVRLGMNPKEYHLHKENLELTEQLAKANERVAELEFKGSLAYSEETGFIDLNKFAIEQKAEILDSLKNKWIKKASEMPMQLECRSKGASCYNWAMYYARELTDEAEKLRKEQE